MALRILSSWSCNLLKSSDFSIRSLGRGCNANLDFDATQFCQLLSRSSFGNCWFCWWTSSSWIHICNCRVLLTPHNLYDAISSPLKAEKLQCMPLKWNPKFARYWTKAWRPHLEEIHVYSVRMRGDKLWTYHRFGRNYSRCLWQLPLFTIFPASLNCLGSGWDWSCHCRCLTRHS